MRRVFSWRCIPQWTLIALAIGMGWMSWGFAREGGDDLAGPGAVPLALCVLLVAFAGVRLAQKALGRDLPVPEAEGVPRGGRFWVAPSLVALYIAAMPCVGFIVSSALLVAALVWAGGYRKIVRALAFGFVLAYVLYLVFGVWMQVPLPEGWLG